MRQPFPSLTPPNLPAQPENSDGMEELSQGGNTQELALKAEIFTSNYSNLGTFQQEKEQERDQPTYSSTCEDDNADGGGRATELSARASSFPVPPCRGPPQQKRPQEH